MSTARDRIPLQARFKDPVSGLTHLGGLLAACAGTVALLLGAPRTASAMAVALIYGGSLIALYAASSVYHLVRGTEAMDRLLRRFDHCAIFLLIAGTYTPILWWALQGTQRAVYLAVVWGLALAGIVMRIAWLGAPRWLYTAMYLGMGWIGVLQGPTFWRALPGDVLAWVVAGGLTYTAGAVIYALKRPNPLPGRFGFHEVWHLFVLVASVLHFVAVFLLSRR
jgi:hemolysin III